MVVSRRHVHVEVVVVVSSLIRHAISQAQHLDVVLHIGVDVVELVIIVVHLLALVAR